MARTTRKQNFQASYSGRYRPSTSRTTKELVIHKMMDTLYQPHWDFWHKKLLEVITHNKDAQGREGNPNLFGIFYAGRPWFVTWMDASTKRDFEVLPMHETIDEKNIIKITANLGELDIECYEVKRFLAGILMFPAPLDTIEDLLGRGLFARVSKFFKEIELDNDGRPWNTAQIVAFETYTKQHDYLITAMSQRVMMNLIARDAFAQ